MFGKFALKNIFNNRVLLESKEHTVVQNASLSDSDGVAYSAGRVFKRMKNNKGQLLLRKSRDGQDHL